MLTPGNIEFTILGANTSPIQIEAHCEEAIKYGYGAVCVPPYYVSHCKKLLKGSNVKIITVIGFPYGYNITCAKVEEIKRAINDGVDEVDVVINLIAVQDNNWQYLNNDIESTVRIAHLHGIKIKYIIEVTLLTEKEILMVCDLCVKNSVNYVKTSTGLNGGASTEAVEKLRKILPKEIKIKASGGIKTKKSAENLINFGADTIGTSVSLFKEN